MIAQIVFRDGDTDRVMILDDDGKWQGPKPWARLLNRLALAVSRDLSPSMGQPYYRHVIEVATLLDASLVFESKRRPEGEVVY